MSKYSLQILDVIQKPNDIWYLSLKKCSYRMLTYLSVKFLNNQPTEYEKRLRSILDRFRYKKYDYLTDVYEFELLEDCFFTTIDYQVLALAIKSGILVRLCQHDLTCLHKRIQKSEMLHKNNTELNILKIFYKLQKENFRKSEFVTSFYVDYQLEKSTFRVVTETVALGAIISGKWTSFITKNIFF